MAPLLSTMHFLFTYNVRFSIPQVEAARRESSGSKSAAPTSFHRGKAWILRQHPCGLKKLRAISARWLDGHSLSVLCAAGVQGYMTARSPQHEMVQAATNNELVSQCWHILDSFKLVRHGCGPYTRSSKHDVQVSDVLQMLQT